jgi:hypothetical protein
MISPRLPRGGEELDGSTSMDRLDALYDGDYLWKDEMDIQVHIVILPSIWF